MNNASKLVITLEVLLKLQSGNDLTHYERRQLVGAAQKALDALRDDFQVQQILQPVGAPRSKDDIPF